jgi:hypothetical protein
MAVAEAIPRLAVTARRFADAVQWKRQVASLQASVLKGSALMAAASDSSSSRASIAPPARSVGSSPASPVAVSSTSRESGRAPLPGSAEVLHDRGVAVAATVGSPSAAAVPQPVEAPVMVPAGFDVALASMHARVHKLLQIKTALAAADASTWANNVGLRDCFFASDLRPGAFSSTASATMDLDPLYALEEAMAQAPAAVDTSLQVRVL